MSDPQSPISNLQPPISVAIIGGGITGLTAAWDLQKAGIPYTLLEKSDRYGGKIQTDYIDGVGNSPFIIERAGDAFLAAQKPWAMELAYELGLDDEILTTNPVQPAVYILKDGAFVPIPTGLQLIIPTNRDTFLASLLMSEDGKARVMAEATIDPIMGTEDESVADFVRRRLGEEAVEMLAEPLLSGIYSTHPEEQSLLATFPRFRQLEQKYGSLIGGARAAATARKRDAQEDTTNQSTSRPTTAFISFKNGTEVLVKALATRLTGDVRLNTGVTAIEVGAVCNRTSSENPNASSLQDSTAKSSAYVLHLDNDETLCADHILVTTPAATSARLLRTVAPAAIDPLNTLRVVSTGVVFLAYRKADVTHPLDSFGVVVPRREQRSINAMTWMSTKFSHRAPADHVLLRVFFGGARTPQMMDKTDTEVLAVVRGELQDLLGIDAAPVLHRVYRWLNAQPQYDVGHLDRMAALHENLPAGIQIAGSPYGGVGIPDCVRQGREAVRKIVNNCQ